MQCALSCGSDRNSFRSIILHGDIQYTAVHSVFNDFFSTALKKWGDKKNSEEKRKSNKRRPRKFFQSRLVFR